MRQHVTVVVEDHVILVDYQPLWFDFQLIPSHVTLRALQWHNGNGHIEQINGLPNIKLATEQDYIENVQPYVEQWETEYERREPLVQEKEEE